MESFMDEVSHLRIALRQLGGAVIGLYMHPAFDTSPMTPDEDVSDRGEMRANLTLAYRHIEDAIMRLGKAIQAFDGGKSVYDREKKQHG